VIPIPADTSTTAHELSVEMRGCLDSLNPNP
jgi:hypothetical protein